MKKGLWAALLVVCWLPVAVAQESDGDAGDSAILEAADSPQAAERLATLLDDREALNDALGEARQSLEQAQQRREQLESRQNDLKARIDELNQQRGDEAGELQAVFDVARRHAGEVRDELAPSWLTVGGDAALPERIDDDAIPDAAALKALGDSLAALTRASGRALEFTAPVANDEGQVSSREAIRLGAFGAFSDGHWLRLPQQEGPLATFETPRAVADKLQAFAQGDSDSLALDPTQGEVLSALAQQPSLWQRFQQGGAVGYVVVSLGLLGLLVALMQYAYLLLVSRRVARQLRDPDHPRLDNPLGRVLARFDALSRDQAPEALEARLDEALLAEQPRLERGQPLVKLLAAVAPLLGLLGTVTGMIVTFQSITVFGTGDPQLMAGGISQALVTTVLGLITAVPLLFAHTALVSRSRILVGILEGRASDRLAQRLEPQPLSSEPRHAAPA